MIYPLVAVLLIPLAWWITGTTGKKSWSAGTVE